MSILLHFPFKVAGHLQPRKVEQRLFRSCQSFCQAQAVFQENRNRSERVDELYKSRLDFLKALPSVKIYQAAPLLASSVFYLKCQAEDRLEKELDHLKVCIKDHQSFREKGLRPEAIERQQHFKDCLAHIEECIVPLQDKKQEIVAFNSWVVQFLERHWIEIKNDWTQTKGCSLETSFDHNELASSKTLLLLTLIKVMDEHVQESEKSGPLYFQQSIPQESTVRKVQTEMAEKQKPHFPSILLDYFPNLPSWTESYQNLSPTEKKALCERFLSEREDLEASDLDFLRLEMACSLDRSYYEMPDLEESWKKKVALLLEKHAQ